MIDEDESGMMNLSIMRKHPTKNGNQAAASQTNVVQKLMLNVSSLLVDGPARGRGYGQVPDVMISDLHWRLLVIRSECLLNASVEKDPAAIYRHLVDVLKAGGPTWERASTNATGTLMYVIDIRC